MVLDSVICCVDILAVRYNAVTQQKECLLVERGSEPVKGVWWLPGKQNVDKHDHVYFNIFFVPNTTVTTPCP